MDFNVYPLFLSAYLLNDGKDTNEQIPSSSKTCRAIYPKFTPSHSISSLTSGLFTDVYGFSLLSDAYLLKISHPTYQKQYKSRGKAPAYIRLNTHHTLLALSSNLNNVGVDWY